MKEFIAEDYLEDIQRKIPGYRLMQEIIFDAVLPVEKQGLTVTEALSIGGQAEEIKGLYRHFPHAAITLVEPNAQMLMSVKKQCADYTTAIPVRYEESAFETYTGVKPYQICLCLLVLQFVKNPLAFLQKIYAELDTNGLLFLSIFSNEQLDYWKEFALSKNAPAEQVEKTFLHQQEVMNLLASADVEQMLVQTGFSGTTLCRILSSSLWLCRKR